ncbi:phosphoglucosamine mutase [Candidatus Poribacteria bacterium]|nr:phosphoglucosamine mutase [Candidatus Poribacteria bacterium]MBT5535647.1 phosphoglucosamine mutase [Candidatus Poribacteria bacterium]MBT5711372.1 phosphoglucosamine mutase [Candidatus Poribacteria bacterium]MBT7099117.1 phosphoglucosamine mutase [Candidatus Poribacteria bacterium]MBT7805590.1 phosphoglucosamine mutase [Candidatus Poribacteria bacterium]
MTGRDPTPPVGDDAVFGVSGFRSRVAESFTPLVVLRLTQAFATLVRKRGGTSVVVGRDTRPSGISAFHAAAAGLTASGLNVVDVGVAPTPTVLHAAAAYGADGCMTITASHNPAEWNGVEFAAENGRLLAAEEREALASAFERGSTALAAWDAQGRHAVRDDAIDQHIERILGLPEVDAEAVSERRPRVVIDACNGAGSTISPALLRRLGCDVVELYCTPDGRFPRSTEPTGEGIGALREAVRNEGADIGFAHDVDADRTVLVDERGEFLPEEYTFALVADAILRDDRRPVVTTAVTGGLVDEVAAAHGVDVFRTPVGVGHVVDRMREVDAAVGGESTGGVVIPGTHLTADGIAALAVIVTGMARGDMSLSAWAARFRRYHLVKAKAPMDGAMDVENALAALVGMYPDASMNRMDGLKLEFGDAWLVVRPSGTEPVLRVFAESPDRDRAEGLVAQALERVREVTG